jgi:tetratricopeptide (TPR) repeat protein
MKSLKSVLTPLLPVFALFLLPLFTGCPWDRPDYRALAERMGTLEEEGSVTPDEERINELKADIRRVDKEIDDTVDKVRDKGTYYKLLGLKYMDYEMWGQGVQAFNSALDVYPENSRLHYYRGVCLAQSGINESNKTLRNELFERAEADYLRSSELDRIYTSPLWGLAILYIYEMDRAVEAALILDRLLSIEPSNEKAIFLRAELYREAGDKMRALELYRKLEVEGKSKEIKDEAEQRAAALGG